MKKIIMVPVFFVLTFVLFANSANAELVVFDGSSVVERTSIRVDLYHSNGKISGSFVVGSMGPDIECTDDKWDGGKMRKTAGSIASYINSHDDIDPIKVMTKAGLTGCKRK